MTPDTELEIYEAAQAYRNAPITKQKEVTFLFEDMVTTIWNAAIRDAIAMGPTGILGALIRLHPERGPILMEMNNVPPGEINFDRLCEITKEFVLMFSPMPPYYRVNGFTFNALKAALGQDDPRCLKPFIGKPLIGVEFIIDDKVPNGEAWPPKGWIADV